MYGLIIVESIFTCIFVTGNSDIIYELLFDSHENVVISSCLEEPEAAPTIKKKAPENSEFSLTDDLNLLKL